MESAKCPSTDGWIKKMWYLYTMEFYSAIKEKLNYVICRKMGRTGEHHDK
jgi:hypothetical protein